MYLSTLATQDWSDCYPRILVDYGWDLEIVNGASRVFQFLDKEFSKAPVATDSTGVKRLLKKCLLELFSVQSQVSGGILYTTLHIAVDAIIGATCINESCKRRLYKQKRGLDGMEIVYSLLSEEGLSLADYQAQAFYHIFPTSFPVTRDLIYAAEGVVAGWNVLWKPSTRAKDVFQIHVCAGKIRRDNFTYRVVKEEVEYPEMFDDVFEPYNFIENRNYVGLYPQGEIGEATAQYAMSVTGTSLNVKSSILHRSSTTGIETRYSLSWRDSIYSLATAQHLWGESITCVE